MKTKRLILVVLGISTLAAVPSMAGVGIQINVPAPVVAVPAPVVTVQTPGVVVEAVPDSYVWDGVEFVGVVGSDYFYLGPGDVWLTLDAPRLARFHDWEHGHPDWRTHAVHNDKYRHDAHGHEAPMRENRDVHDATQMHDNHDAHVDDHGHDSDHDRR
jgi:hypothetical protein